MTRNEVKSAKQKTVNEKEILVHKHKRSQDGPAPLILPNQHYDWLLTFESEKSDSNGCVKCVYILGRQIIKIGSSKCSTG